MIRIFYHIAKAKRTPKSEISINNCNENCPEPKQCINGDRKSSQNGNRSEKYNSEKIFKNGDQLLQILMPNPSALPGNSFTLYMFSSINSNTLEYAVNRLQYFRYIRAHGGHANDGDSIAMTIEINQPKEFLMFLSQIGAESISYKKLDESKFHSIDTRLALKCLGLLDIINAYEVGKIWMSLKIDDKRMISLEMASGYEVTREILTIASRIEELARELNALLVDPPKYKDNKRCVCPKYYNEIFE